MHPVLRSFLLIVGLPTFIATVYFSLFASDIFVSETRFAIRESKAGKASSIAGLLSSTGITSGGQDARVVVDYIKSQDILASLNAQLNLSQHFSDSGIDFVARLSSEHTREELLDHYIKHVEIIEDSGSDIIVLKTKAYDPEYAKRMAEYIITLSEKLVNDMSTRIENDGLQAAKDEVELAASRVLEASRQLTKFRGINTSINPAEEGMALLGLISGIENKLVIAKTELSEKRAFMKDDSSVVKSLKNKVDALETQLKKERLRVASESGTGFNELINDYQPLALQQSLAQQHYTSALHSLELARIEALRKKSYLTTYVKPVLPDEALEPERVMNILTVFIYAFMFFAIGGLMWSALRDHIGH